MEQSTSQSARTLQTASRQDTMQESQISDQMERSLRKVGFIDKGTGEHQSNQIFDSDGIIPCQSASQYKEPIKICVK